MYIVKKYFNDLTDGNRAYNPGDTFPREGLEVPEKRLTELSTSQNRRGTPLIEEVPVEEPTEEPKKPAKRRKGKE